MESGGDNAFGPGDYVEFVGEAVDSMYTTRNVYRLQVSPNSTFMAQVDATKPDGSLTATTYAMATKEVERNVFYDMSSPGDDPWYETFFGPSYDGASKFTLDSVLSDGPAADV